MRNFIQQNLGCKITWSGVDRASVLMHSEASDNQRDSSEQHTSDCDSLNWFKTDESLHLKKSS